MVQVVEAVFDRHVLRPEEPLRFTQNERVRITIESVERPSRDDTSFFATARSLNLDGPPDWSENLDKYLYGELVDWT